MEFQSGARWGQGWWKEWEVRAGTRGASMADVVWRERSPTRCRQGTGASKPLGCCLPLSLCPGLHEEQGVPSYPLVLRFVLESLERLP